MEIDDHFRFDDYLFSEALCCCIGACDDTIPLYDVPLIHDFAMAF